MLASLTEVINEAKKTGGAALSVNTPNSESLFAALDSAEELNVPIIIAHAQIHEDAAPLEKIGPLMIDAAKRSKVKVCVHLDHGEDAEYCKKAIELGFNSIMIAELFSFSSFPDIFQRAALLDHMGTACF